MKVHVLLDWAGTGKIEGKYLKNLKAAGVELERYQIEGPAVVQTQAAFTDNWSKTRAPVLFGSNYFPELKPVGSSART